MFSRIKNAWHITKKSYQWLFHYPSLWLIPLSEIAIYCLLIALLLVIFNYNFQIHVLDESTLERLGLISIWESGIFTLVVIGPLYFLSSIVLLRSQLSLIYAYKAIESSKKLSIITCMIQSVKKVPDIIHYALLSTLVAVTFEPGLKRSVKKKIRHLGGHEFVPQTHLDTWHEQTYLIMPTLGLESLSVPQAVSRSRTLMNNTFGPHPIAQLSFMQLALILIIPLCSLTYYVTIYLSHQGIALIAILVVASIIKVLLRTGEGIFQLATYTYCLGQPNMIINDKDIAPQFKPAP